MNWRKRCKFPEPQFLKPQIETMITISHRLTAGIQRVTIWPWKNSIWHRVITQILLYGCSTIGHQTWRIFPVGSDIKNLPACRTSRFDPWVGKIPWRRKWQSTPVFLPAELHGQRSLVGYSPQGRKQLHRTEWLTHTHGHTHGHTHTQPCVHWGTLWSCRKCVLNE